MIKNTETKHECNCRRGCDMVFVIEKLSEMIEMKRNVLKDLIYICSVFFNAAMALNIEQ